MKITKERIAAETVHHKGYSYQGPNKFTVPLVFLYKKGLTVQVNRISQFLQLSEWKGK